MTLPGDDLAARYRALFETTPDGIMIVDDAGLYVDVNGAMCAMLGTTRENILGRHFREFIPPERLEEALTAFATLQTSGALAVEFPVRTADGRIVNLEWRSRASFVPGLHLCVAHDLSSRDAAQQALRDSDERYRAFLANSSEAIWRIELPEGVSTALPPDEQIEQWYASGYLAECNDVMARMYGASSGAELVGARLGDMLVREDPANVEYLRAFIASGYHLSGAESHEVDREGREKFFVNSLVGIVRDGLLVRAWGTQRDATGEKRIERDRAALVTRLELLADVTSVLGSSLDYDRTLQSIAAAVVPRLADWCFVDIRNVHGEVERALAHHEDPARVSFLREMERRHPAAAGVPFGPMQTIRTGVAQTVAIDGAMIRAHARSDEHAAMLEELALISAVVVPLNARGRTFGALTFAQAESNRSFTAEDIQLAEDIGRRAGLAIDNAALYRELDRANRSKDDFLAMLSHELRTPMTATLGWATMMQTRAMPEELLATAADAIAQSTRMQARLVEDLLDISRIVSGKMQLVLADVVISELLSAAVQTVRPAAEGKQIQVEMVDRAEGVRLTADAERLQQVFWNLLSNAVKFTPRGGHVGVEVFREGDSVHVVVRDDGEGMDRDLLPYIFERFRQGDSGASRKFGGLGLGLSIARNLVELHGGTLSASSAGPGLGSEFTVVLPLRGK